MALLRPEHGARYVGDQHRDGTGSDVRTIRSRPRARGETSPKAAKRATTILTALWLRNCSDILVSSWAGNVAATRGQLLPPGFAQYPPSLIRVEDSCPITFANLVDQFQFAPDDDWNFVYDKYGALRS